MKKIVLALLVATGMTYAIDCSVYPDSSGIDTRLWHESCAPVFAEPGPQGEPGIDGIDGKDGIDGQDGADGRDGNDGADGRDGIDGKDGEDGKDFNSALYVKEYTKLIKELRDSQEYAMQADAGNTAMAVIDFGSVCKGETAVGVGVGTSHSRFGTAVAGAVGAKQGITDDTAVVAKAWGANSDSYGGGLGLVHKF